MLLDKLLAQSSALAQKAIAVRLTKAAASALEPLEERRLFSTFTVTNLNDAGSGSLRAAIESANGTPASDTIQFSSSLEGTIPLTSGSLPITSSINIQGPGAGKITLDGKDNGAEDSPARILTIAADGLPIEVGLSGLTLANGESEHQGGAIANGGAALVVSDVVIRDCFADEAGGGGIFSGGGDLTVVNSTIRSNDAAGGGFGGGICVDGGTLTLRGSTVSGNLTANEGAGGVDVIGDVLIENCTISGNSGATGGVAIDGDGVISNSTIVGNVAYYSGGAGVLLAEGSDVTAISTIIANNAFGNASEVPLDVMGTLVAQSSLIETVGDASVTGSGNLFGVDPKLGPLADNGGPTQTHALLAGSPAIDAGSNPAGLDTDQRGKPRVQGAAADIGAYESSGGDGGGGGTAVIGPDPSSSTSQALIVNGTDGDDTISIDQSSSGRIKVKINGSDKGQFNATNRIYAYAGAGNDKVTVSSKVKKTVFLFGGDGNDTLSGGGANDVIAGGSGADSLKGNGGRDILIGEAGGDTVSGGGGDDVLIGDKMRVPFSEAELRSLLAEWANPKTSYATRRDALLSGRGKATLALGSRTLDEDGRTDTLSGNGGIDLFLCNTGAGTEGPTDKVKDKSSGERVVDID